MRLAQLLPPAILLALAISTRTSTVGGGYTGTGILVGTAYIIFVVAISACATFALGSRNIPSRADTFSVISFIAEVAVVFLGLFVVSRHTFVVTADGQLEYWSWFPGWLAALCGALSLAWGAWRLTLGWSAQRIEQRFRTVVVGSTLAFFLVAHMPEAAGGFQGYDDAQSVTGADLLTRGYFPWRDFMFIHGIFEDALRSLIGFGVFEHSVWGASAGTAIFIMPACWIGYYLLAVWASPKGSPVPLIVLATAAWGGMSVGIGVSTRWVALCFVFILLGEAIRREHPGWTVLLTSVLFVDAILVPEASFQVIAVAATLIASDIVHRPLGTSRWRALGRTRVFVCTGLACSALLAAFLAANRSLSQFVDYYRVFGPDHAAAGAVPPTGVATRDYILFGILCALVILTLWSFTWRILTRRTLSARDWVTFGAAILAGLYGEKAIGRFDQGHVLQAVAVSLPLWILWITASISAADRFVAVQLKRRSRIKPRTLVIRQPVAVAVVLASIAILPGAAHAAWRAPGQTKQVVAGQATVPLFGYNSSSAIDATKLADLETILDTYAGNEGKVFDFTNSLGYFYYLMQRDPAGTYVHISMAEPEFAQDQVVDQLAEIRPSVVIFDGNLFGLPAWDGPRNNVRHFEVAQYILDGWTPIVRSHSVMFMVRNDLVQETLTPLPPLSVPPTTSNLYFPSNTCDFGDTANFLPSSPSGTAVTLPVTRMGEVRRIQVAGWAYDPAASRPASQVLFAIGHDIFGSITPALSRADVAAVVGPSAISSGFNGVVRTDRSGAIQAFALLSDGQAHPLGSPKGDQIDRLTMPDGTTVPVAPTPAAGSIDATTTTDEHLGVITLPAAAAAFPSYALATLASDGDIGESNVTLTDRLPTAPPPNRVDANREGSHDIVLRTLPEGGAAVAVRVGVCLQWRGYQGQQIYLLQSGGELITEVTLSGVED